MKIELQGEAPHIEDVMDLLEDNLTAYDYRLYGGKILAIKESDTAGVMVMVSNDKISVIPFFPFPFASIIFIIVVFVLAIVIPLLIWIFVFRSEQVEVEQRVGKFLSKHYR